jgi:GTP cyclohydrolase FolE2
MWHERILYSRAAKGRLRALPLEVQLDLETHLENLALVVESLPPERLPQLLSRNEEGFVTEVKGARVFFVVDTVGRAVLVYRIEALSVGWEPASALHAKTGGPEGGHAI